MAVFPKTTKIEIRIEDEILKQIPENGRNKWINDACREKIEGPSIESAASILGKAGGARSSEKKTIAVRENAKKPRKKN